MTIDRLRMSLFSATFALPMLLFPDAPAAAYTEIAVQGGALISGQLTFQGDLPLNAIETIAIEKNPEVCGEGFREVVWVDVLEGALRGAFVFVDSIEEGKPWGTLPDAGHLIDQRGCRFLPWAQVVRPGPLTIRNSDQDVLHNINVRELIGVERGRDVKRTMFNFGQPEPGDLEVEVFPRRSPYISLNCEAHNFMFGFMMAPDNPYAVVVDDNGRYLLTDVPPGNYVVRAWHPTLGLQETEVQIEADATVEVNFSFGG